MIEQKIPNLIQRTNLFPSGSVLIRLRKYTRENKKIIMRVVCFGYNTDIDSEEGDVDVANIFDFVSYIVVQGLI